MTVLETRNLTKVFPGVRALSNFSFELERGEVHGLVGENGAGKSTLVKVLAGVYAPTSGSFFLDGTEKRFRSPRDACDLIGVVHQERELVPHFSGWENLFLGLEYSSLGFLLKKKMREDAIKFAEKYSMVTDLSARASDLGSGSQEMLSILKVLFRNPKVIIFDEPTAPLSVNECESLFSLVRDLKAAGATILYISHHLSEVLQLCDRVTVMRNGEKVGTRDAGKTDEQELIRMMIDRDLAGQFPKRPVEKGGEVFAMEGCSFRSGRFTDLSFSICRGEIVGFAGLVGAGRTELARAVYCGLPLETGTMKLAGRPFASGSPQESIARGVVMIPENRRADGVIEELTLGENLVLPLLGAFSCAGFIRKKGASAHAVSISEKLSIKATGLSQKVRTLSGGNQQKVSVGKWFGRKSLLWIFDEPTQGIDVETKREMYSIMEDLAEEGAGIWFISSELRELMAMADRIIVMKNSSIVSEFRPPFDGEEILTAMMGEGE